MDLTTTTTTTIPTKTYDTENENPLQTQPIKPLSCTNGALKKRHHHPPPAVVVTYKECLKNHAARLGGHALDGCGEFMPSPNTTHPTTLKCAAATTPTSLKCAACGCHRNFHRREVNDSTTHSLDFHRRQPPPRRTSPPPPPPSNYSYAPGVLLAFSTAVTEDQPANTHHPVTTPATQTAVKAENPSGRKRFRTKFSQEQKNKMFLFAEKLGWKMQKNDEEMVEEFCNEIGIRKVVLKVWIHNNKYTFCKRDAAAAATTTTATSNGRVSFDNNGYYSNNNTNGHHHNESNGVHLHVSTNGSSSSS